MENREGRFSPFGELHGTIEFENHGFRCSSTVRQWPLVNPDFEAIRLEK